MAIAIIGAAIFAIVVLFALSFTHMIRVAPLDPPWAREIKPPSEEPGSVALRPIRVVHVHSGHDSHHTPIASRNSQEAHLN